MMFLFVGFGECAGGIALGSVLQMLKADITYRINRSIVVNDVATGMPIELHLHERYLAVNRRTLLDPKTGQELRVPAHLVANTSWWCTKDEVMGRPAPVEPTQRQFALAIVEHHPKLMLRDLYTIATENNVSAKPFKRIEDFSSHLSKEERIKMYDTDGNPVEKINHNKKYCTYRLETTGLPVHSFR